MVSAYEINQRHDAAMTVLHNISGLTRRILGLGLAAGLALAVAGCGKKGPLEPPPGSPDAPKAAPADATQGGIVTLRGGAKKRPPPIKPPKDDFFLDFLL